MKDLVYGCLLYNKYPEVHCLCLALCDFIPLQLTEVVENLIIHVVDYDSTMAVNWLSAIFRYEKSHRGTFGSLEKAEIAWASLLK